MCVGPAVFLGDMEKGPHGPESMNMIKPCVLFFFQLHSSSITDGLL